MLKYFSWPSIYPSQRKDWHLSKSPEIQGLTKFQIHVPLLMWFMLSLRRQSIPARSDISPMVTPGAWWQSSRPLLSHLEKIVATVSCRHIRILQPFWEIAVFGWGKFGSQWLRKDATGWRERNWLEILLQLFSVDEPEASTDLVQPLQFCSSCSWWGWLR